MRTSHLNLAFAVACSLFAGLGCGPGGDLPPLAETGSEGSSALGGVEHRIPSASATEDDEGSTTDTDGGGPECGTPCELWNADDCLPDEKCTAVACDPDESGWDANVCRPLLGDGALGDACSEMGDANDGRDDCGPGLMCWGAASGQGVCVAFCEGSAEAPSCDHVPASQCAVYNAGVLPLCVPDCEPLAMDCAPGMACLPRPGNTGFGCVLDASGGVAPYGTTCEYINACNPGLLCISGALVPEGDCASAWGCCSPYCELGGPEDCPGAGQSCQPIFGESGVVPGFENVGACALP